MATYPNYPTYTAPAESTIGTGATYGLLCENVASMDAAAVATVQSIQQETAVVAGIHYFATAAVTEANTYKLLNSFTINGYGPGGFTDGANVFSAVLSNSANFKAVLQQALEDASGSIDTDLATDLNAQLRVWLQSDSLINAVQNMFGATVVDIDEDGGAQSMADGLEADSNYVEGIFTQIDTGTLGLYMDASEEPVTNALPLKGGDKLTFVFDVAPEVEIAYAQNDITGDLGVAVEGSHAGAKAITGAVRRVALTMTLHGSGALVTYNPVESVQPALYLKGPDGE
jgi:hypothetical protein